MSTEAVSPAAPPHDRGHDNSPVRRAHEEGLHPSGPRVHGLPRPFARPSRAGGSPALSASPGFARRELLPHERGRQRAPVLLPHYPGPLGVRRPHGQNPDARAPTGRTQPGGGGAAARARAEPEVPGRAERRLRLRSARVRDHQLEDRGHRQRPHADPRGAGQGAARTATSCWLRTCSACCASGGW